MRRAQLAIVESSFRFHAALFCSSVNRGENAGAPVAAAAVSHSNTSLTCAITTDSTQWQHAGYHGIAKAKTCHSGLTDVLSAHNIN